ncbi:DUF4184 family protein [Chengkuizengella sediminis]|uniref:DUF4184 family protein n=1 Tax=Chengkuizengella sediminis TaxID=1885917 RepID=UPI001389E7A8|nr:DUF4184 family protein [Chengkuizengella sediminis]NDI36526.1 DUF4184 family protein [Chengkuizengella sediminis]
MPFTFSHPLYAIPLKWIKPKYFCVTGLVLGSMSPDFEYFIALEPYRTIGHSVTGLFMQSIPLSILFAFIFHKIIVKTLSLHLPSFYNLDMRSYQVFHSWQLNTFRKWIVFLTSVVIGFYSHIFVDSFTHTGGYFVLRFSFFSNTINSIPIYKFLQHILSLSGLLFLTLLCFKVLRKQNNFQRKRIISQKQKLKYWSVVLFTALVVTTLKLLFTSSTNIIGIIIVSPISGTLLGIFAASMFYKINKRRNIK